jgi:TolB-like protein/Flp pilus assembly protein TadD
LHYLFAGFSLDTDRRELRHGDGLLRLEPKAFDLLAYLIANRERVVSKDDLLAAVWNGRIISESSLTTCVNAVRKAIDDNGKAQRLIKTLQRKGFRFVADVREERNSRYAGVGEISLDASKPALALPEKPSIAVLPFLNLSGDPEQEYFTDGVTEDIITELSRFHSLFVIARNSSFSYKGISRDVRLVGRELGVRYVLDGSIRKLTNRIRMTGQLTDTLTGNHIWAERYDRVVEDIFTVQEELTKAIVAAIEPQIEATEQLKVTRRRPSNLSAYEIAIQARAHSWDGVDMPDRTLLDQAIRKAKEALAIDPNSVLALHALALSHGAAFFYEMAADREHALREAMWAVTRAVELDSADAHGYALRAVNMMYRGQWDRYAEALADARRAHEMNPNDTLVLRIFGILEALAGDPDSGIEHLHQVTRLNPRNPRSYTTYRDLGVACFVAKRYAESIDWASRALRERPSNIQSHINIVLDFVGLGEIGKAKAMFETLRKVASPELLRSRLEGMWAFGRSEDRGRATIFLRVAAGLEDPSAADEVS